MPDGGAARIDGRKIAARVIALLEKELAADGFDLLDVRVFQGGGRFQVRVYVDVPGGGIDLGQCTAASRTVGMLLEEADLFTGQYVIEVSSPGVRRPLRRLEHFQAAVGQQVELKLLPGSGSSRLRGTLQAVEGSELVVVREAPAAPEGEAQENPTEALPQRVPITRVREANLDPVFDAQALINADRRRKREEKRAERQEKRGEGRKSRPRKK